uniref:Uncharacterized protein n=1 Tax=Physcomitrium patens TaxID=3218 RepID=A0A2K1JRA9_PHYPA|nr:hypothetical protein PHYPA_016446 [Physcomitrium patens]
MRSQGDSHRCTQLELQDPNPQAPNACSEGHYEIRKGLFCLLAGVVARKVGDGGICVPVKV